MVLAEAAALCDQLEDVASFKNAMPLKSSERKLVPVNA